MISRRYVSASTTASRTSAIRKVFKLQLKKSNSKRFITLFDYGAQKNPLHATINAGFESLSLLAGSFCWEGLRELHKTNLVQGLEVQNPGKTSSYPIGPIYYFMIEDRRAFEHLLSGMLTMMAI